MMNSTNVNAMSVDAAYHAKLTEVLEEFVSGMAAQLPALNWLTGFQRVEYWAEKVADHRAAIGAQGISSLLIRKTFHMQIFLETKDGKIFGWYRSDDDTRLTTIQMLRWLAMRG